MTHHLLAGFPVTVLNPVRWGDMDAYGHVNNTVFFQLFESARVAYLDACGFAESHRTHRVGAILHSTACRFRHPLQYPEEVIVGGRTINLQEDRFEMAYAIVSTTHDRLAADGTGLIVSYDYANHTKTPIPDAVRSGIEALEAGTLRR